MSSGISDLMQLNLPNINTGSLTNYYLVQVDHPQRVEQEPYQAECEDLIEALNMNFDQGNIFKELWRSANESNGNGKPGNTEIRAAEKILHYAKRLHARALRNANNKQT